MLLLLSNIMLLVETVLLKRVLSLLSLLLVMVVVEL